MFYTILFVILWLMSGGAALAIGTPVFWALIVAVLADIFAFGYLRRQAWYRG
jgi:hypothetical protein